MQSFGRAVLIKADATQIICLNEGNEYVLDIAINLCGDKGVWMHQKTFPFKNESDQKNVL